MKKLLVFFLLLSFLSCEKKSRIAEVEQHLKKAMTTFLYGTVNNDSSKVKFNVKEVVFFEDAGFYECEFNVKMLLGGKDTTGIMKARVSKDFSKVNRKM